MNHRILPLLMGSLLLLLGCESDPTAPLPSELCSDYPSSAIAKFEDDNLEAEVVRSLGVGGSRDLTCALVSGMTRFNASDSEIESLVGVQNLTGLTEFLSLWGNSISDISPLSGLTRLRILLLHRNAITDVSALSGLTNLTTLDLNSNEITDISPLGGLTPLGNLDLVLTNNPISDIRPLVDNTGLGVGDTVHLYNTNVTCVDVAALEAKGVTVRSDCP